MKENKEKLMKVFIRFLKETNAYTRFMDNINDDSIAFFKINNRRLVDISRGSCLLDMFDWGCSKEGARYWITLDEKWKILWNNFSKKIQDL